MNGGKAQSHRPGAAETMPDEQFPGGKINGLRSQTAVTNHQQLKGFSPAVTNRGRPTRYFLGLCCSRMSAPWRSRSPRFGHRSTAALKAAQGSPKRGGGKCETVQFGHTEWSDCRSGYLTAT